MGASAFRIQVTLGKRSATVHDLPAEGIFKVGSSPACWIVLDAPRVEAVHCFLRTRGGRIAVLVKDERSEVRLNGERVEKKVLEVGDTLEVGEAKLVFEGLCEADPLVGAVLGGYRIERPLGRGAMGAVYKATQLSLARDVALKVLSAELSKDAGFVKRFLEEARAAAKLNHPNVVPVYDAAQAQLQVRPETASEDETRKFYFFSMEFVPGGTLEDRLERERRLEIETALEIGCDTARALVWAEEHGIVHRDIKPANLLFTAGGSVKVADLGIAADVEREAEGGGHLKAAGSPRFMAPEQALGERVDHRADIYALGSTLYLAMSGQHPFDGTAQDVVRAKTTQSAPPLENLLPKAPAPVTALIGRMLARNPGDRPQTCGELLTALTECLDLVRRPTDGKKTLEPTPGAGPAPEPRGAPARAPQAEAKRSPALSRPEGPRPPARAAHTSGRRSPWESFLRSTAGKLNLSLSSLLVFAALVWALTAELEAPRGEENRAVVVSSRGSSIAPVAPPLPAPVVEEASGSGEEASAADRELEHIQSEWQEGIMDDAQALKRVEKFLERHRGHAKAEALARGLRDKKADKGRALLDQLWAGELRQMREKSHYHEALERLEKFGRAHPEIQEQVRAKVDDVKVEATSALERARERARGLAEKGDFAGAVAEIEGLAAFLPQDLRDKAEEQMKGLRAEAQGHATGTLELEAAAERVEDALLALDFERSRSIATAIPEPAAAALKARRAAIVAEVARCEDTWRKLAAKNGGRRPEEILEAPAVEILKAAAGDTPSAEDIESLGLLLLHARGPAEARSLLLDPRLGAEKRSTYTSRLNEEEARFLNRFARRTKLRLAEIKAAGGARAKDYEEVASAVHGVLRKASGFKGFPEKKPELAQVLLEAKVDGLRLSLPGSLFRGEVKSYEPDGLVVLAYNFRSRSEIEDFVPLDAKSGIEWGEKSARLRGQVRFGRGEVFADRLGVTFKVPAGGYTSGFPNLNVSLWTHDRVAPGTEALVLAVGHGRTGESLTVAGGGSVAAPATALLQVRGGDLAAAACLWAQTVNLRGTAQRVRAEMSSEGLTWTRNGQNVVPRRDLERLNLQPPAKALQGSFTFLTGGEILTVESIEVEGKLNPAWVEAHLTDKAREELRAADPEGGW